jgi:hypothetical protein
LALQPLWQQFSSGDSLADALGWSSLPLAQRYGIYLGLLTFVSTVSAVLLLLYCGGTFTRIREQDSEEGPRRSTPAELSATRPLLYEELLQVRQQLLQLYIEGEADAAPQQPRAGARGRLIPTTLCRSLSAMSRSTGWYVLRIVVAWEEAGWFE